MTKQDIRRLMKSMRKDAYRESEKRGLDDDQCDQLIRCALDKDCEAGRHVMVHICVNRPPCEEGETEAFFRGKPDARKFCKGRSKYGTPEFWKRARAIVEAADRRQQKRLAAMPESVRASATRAERTLEKTRREVVEAKISTTPVEQKRVVHATQNVAEGLSSDELQSYLKEVISHPERAREILEPIAKRLAETRDLLGAREEAVVKVSRMTKEIAQGVREGQQRQEQIQERKDAQRAAPRDTATRHAQARHAADQLAVSLETAQATRRLEEAFVGIREELEYIRAQQEENKLQLKEAAKAARKINGTEMWNELLERYTKDGLRGLLRKAVLAPFKLVNSVVLRPAYDAFVTLFGRWAYLLWGVLMLIMLSFLVTWTYSWLSTNQPVFAGILTDSASKLISLSTRTGSIASHAMGPIIREQLSKMWTVTRSTLGTFPANLNKLFWEALSYVTAAFQSALTKAAGKALAAGAKHFNPLTYFSSS